MYSWDRDVGGGPGVAERTPVTSDHQRSSVQSLLASKQDTDTMNTLLHHLLLATFLCLPAHCQGHSVKW